MNSFIYRENFLSEDDTTTLTSEKSQSVVHVLDKQATCEKIKLEMDRQNISIRSLSEILGISYQALWKYTKGLSFPSIDHLYAISKVLDVKVDDLLCEKL